MPTAKYIKGKGLRNNKLFSFRNNLKKWDHVLVKIKVYSFDEKQTIKAIIIGILGEEVFISPVANRAKPFRVDISQIVGFWEPENGLNRCGGYCEKHKSQLFRHTIKGY